MEDEEEEEGLLQESPTELKQEIPKNQQKPQQYDASRYPQGYERRPQGYPRYRYQPPPDVSYKDSYPRESFYARDQPYPSREPPYPRDRADPYPRERAEPPYYPRDPPYSRDRRPPPEHFPSRDRYRSHDPYEQRYSSRPYDQDSRVGSDRYSHDSRPGPPDRNEHSYAPRSHEPVRPYSYRPHDTYREPRTFQGESGRYLELDLDLMNLVDLIRIDLMDLENLVQFKVILAGMRNLWKKNIVIPKDLLRAMVTIVIIQEK